MDTESNSGGTEKQFLSEKLSNNNLGRSEAVSMTWETISHTERRIGGHSHYLDPIHGQNSYTVRSLFDSQNSAFSELLVKERQRRRKAIYFRLHTLILARTVHHCRDVQYTTVSTFRTVLTSLLGLIAEKILSQFLVFKCRSILPIFASVITRSTFCSLVFIICRRSRCLTEATTPLVRVL